MSMKPRTKSYAPEGETRPVRRGAKIEFMWYEVMFFLKN